MIINGSPIGETLTGTPQDDTINAGDGNDTVNGANGNDTVNGEGGNDRLYGGNGDDFLFGGAGDDVLLGNAGVDTLSGGLDNDTYIWDGVDIIVENAGEGTDTVQSAFNYTLGANLENLTFTGTDNLFGFGNALDNVMIGNAGNNLLVGDAGNDTITGGNGSDYLDGGADNDILNGGNGDDILIGDAGADILNGGNGADFLDGGTGADAMAGGAGNDLYVVDNAGDTVVELANQGFDTVQTSLYSYTLTANVENLTGTSSSTQLLTGNNLRNTLTGGDGGDVLNGGGDNDILIGGAGNDRLTGGTGSDTFVFNNSGVGLSSLGGAKQVDTVFDFDFAAGDRIDLSAIDADSTQGGDQAFSFVGKFSHTAGEAVLIYVASTNTTALQLDIDGDGVSDYQINLKNGDFTNAPVVADPSLAHQGGWIL